MAQHRVGQRARRVVTEVLRHSEAQMRPESGGLHVPCRDGCDDCLEPGGGRRAVRSGSVGMPVHGINDNTVRFQVEVDLTKINIHMIE